MCVCVWANFNELPEWKVKHIAAHDESPLLGGFLIAAWRGKLIRASIGVLSSLRCNTNTPVPSLSLSHKGHLCAPVSYTPSDQPKASFCPPWGKPG